MMLERFLEKFEQFADAPNAVAKMRELVLHLAVRGKLVEQSDEDEPASEMLRRLTGRPPLLIDFENLPSNWVCVALGDLIALQKGKKPASLNVEKIGLPYLDIAALERGELRQFTEDSKCPRTTTGDLIIVCDGSRSGLVLDGIDGVLGSTVSKVGHSGFDRNYLKYFLRSLYDDLNGAKKGAAIPHLNIPRLLAIPAQIPPVPEQNRIVAKVDELMALCDRLEAQQQERETRHAAVARASLARFAEAPTPANLDFLFHNSYTITPDDLRKSILTLAVQGKLVPQDPNDEVVDDSVRTARKKARLPTRELSELVATDAPFDTPELWRWVTVADVAGTRLGKMLDKEKNRGEAHSYLRNTNVHWFRFELESIKTMLFERSELDEYRVEPGDVLICEGGHGIARSAVWNGQIADIMFQKALHRVRPLSCLDGRFLTFCLWVYERNGILQRYYTGAGIPHFTGKSLAKVLFPLPPIAEQRRIVAKVDQLMALVDQLEAQLSEARAKSVALLEAVIHELLNPTAEIIDLASYRAAIGCYTIRKMSDKPYFGRTAAMKMFYLAQAHVGMQLDLQPEREAAGPLDQWIYRFEDEAQSQGWFKAVANTSNGKMKVEYQPGKSLAAQAAQGENLLSTEQRKEFDRMLGLLSDKKTEEVEIIATLFAVWNDFLLDGQAPGDDEIVTEVRTNWHEKKERFTPAVLRQWLGWLRQNNLVPQGRLPHTVHQSKLSLS